VHGLDWRLIFAIPAIGIGVGFIVGVAAVALGFVRC
jgi:hypothetical protein